MILSPVTKLTRTIKMKIQKKYLQSILLVCVCCVFLNSTFFALKEEAENEQEEMIQRDLSLNLGNGTCLWLVVFVCHIIPFFNHANAECQMPMILLLCLQHQAAAFL